MRLTAPDDSEAGTTVLFAALRKQHSESTAFADYFEQSKFSMPVIVVFGFLNHTIHMNGRVYDPNLGRMLQADPFIQAPGNTQSYNRYSYVMNNPLGYTDPSGYFSFKEVGGFVFGAALVVVTGGQASPFVATWYGAAGLGAITGGVNAALNGGNVVQGVAIGAFTGAATYGVATGLESQGIGALSAEGVLGFGAVGGVASVASGGKFHHGFIAAGAGGAIGNTGIGGFDQAALRTIGRAIIGGTVSELTGGKFANGAATAAFASIVAEGAMAARTRNYTPISPVNPDVAIGPSGSSMDIFSEDYELTWSLTVEGAPATVAGAGNPVSAFSGPIPSGLGSMVSNSAGNFTFGHVSTGTNLQLSASDLISSGYTNLNQSLGAANRAIGSASTLLGAACPICRPVTGTVGGASAAIEFMSDRGAFNSFAAGKAVELAARRVGFTGHTATQYGGLTDFTYGISR